MRTAILKKVIGSRNIRQFCEDHNLNPSYISQIFNGTKTLGDAAAMKMEDNIGLPAGALSAPQIVHADEFEPAPEIKKWRIAAIKGTAQLGEDGFWCELEGTEGSVETVSSDPDVYALRVKGDSMAPAIRSGWVVWCEPNHELVSGEYVMVKTIDGRCMVKELLYHNNNEISLMSINNQYGRVNISVEEIEQAHYVGGIIPPSKIKYN